MQIAKLYYEDGTEVFGLLPDLQITKLYYVLADGTEGSVFGPPMKLERALKIACHPCEGKIKRWQAYSNGEVVARMPT